MRILLIATDSNRYLKSKYSIRDLYPHLGLNYLKTVLTNKGYQVEVLDSLSVYALSNFKLPINIPNMAKKILEESEAEILGISVLTPYRKMAFDIARFAKEKNPNIKIILGGPHITAMEEFILNRYANLIDAIVIGEGEDTLLELIGAFESKKNLKNVKGIAYVDSNGEIIKNPVRPLIENLDRIPFPNYDQYIKILPDNKLSSVVIMTSRGCPFKCRFCSSSLFWKKWRIRSPKNVVNEIEYLMHKYRVEEIRIWDDTFGINKNQAIGVFRRLVENKIKIRIGYLNTRFDVIDEEILYWYKKAGGTGIFFGLESGSERIRKFMNKNFTNEKVREVINNSKKLGLNIGLFLIFGYPSEKLSDVQETYKLVKEIEPDQVLCNLPLIYPRTDLFNIAKKEGEFNFNEWLQESPDYFTCSDSDETKGYMALFNEIFNNGTPIRTEFENIVYDYFDNDPLYIEKVKRQAKENLIKAGAIL